MNTHNNLLLLTRHGDHRHLQALGQQLVQCYGHSKGVIEDWLLEITQGLGPNGGQGIGQQGSTQISKN